MFHWNSFRPEDPEGTLWDVVIVGTGMGGSVLGWSLARQNLSVLFLERGTPPDPFSSVPRAGYWHRQITAHRDGRTVELDPWLGSGPGGSTTIYGAALERLRREDFAAGEHNALQPPPLSGDWPISYDDLIPYYRKAEALLKVRGTVDRTDPDDDSVLLPPPPLSERDRQLFESFQAAGLAPYRLHVGIDYKPGCAECLGTLCPRECKADAANCALKPALIDCHARLLCGFEVERLGAAEDHIEYVVGKLGNRAAKIRGRVVVLAAGALSTPVLLLSSTSERWPTGVGNDSGLVGQGLMFHVSEFFALWSTRKFPPVGSARAISSRALNCVDGRKLGAIQSVAATVHPFHISTALIKLIERSLGINIPFLKYPIMIGAVLGASIIRRAALFATIVEDLPYRDNRVALDKASPSGFAIVYSNSEELRTRVRMMRKIIRKRLARHRVLFLPLDDNLNYGHPSGTCRFGKCPETSVLTPDNQVRGIRNLFVVDASFFPSSGGINPSLTIAANALRVASIIPRRLEGN